MTVRSAMRGLPVLALVAGVCTSCTPVLDRQLMDSGVREFSLGYLRETPEVFAGTLFILGGVIVETKLLENGSQVEAVYVPVNAQGYLDDPIRAQGRYLAVYPRTRGMLDPIVFRRGRQVTLAAEFLELRKGKIDEMEYAYPVFEIRQVYLWAEHREYVYPPGYYPYPSYYRSPYLYDPWGRPYPNPYWPPPQW